MRPVELRTGRLVLDQPTIDDAELITEYCNDDAFAGQSMTTPWPYELKHAVGFVTELVPEWWRTDAEYTWAIRQGAVLLGVISFRAAGHDIGYWMGAPHRGKGYITEAVTAVLDWVFANGVPEVVWETVVGNASSAAVARRAGFSFSGIRASNFTARDGSHPSAWQGVIAAGDSRDPKPGWPAG